MLEVITIGFFFGASLGSFLNVCAYRIPRGVSVVSERSFCPACGRVLSLFELIPIVSFIIICRGRCTCCRAPISLQYPAVELLSGAWVVLITLTAGLSPEALLLIVFGLSMLLVAIIDWQHYLIPNTVLLWSLFLGIAIKAAMGFSALWPATLALAVSFLVVFLLLLCGRLSFGREVMGMGDVKLAAVIAFMLGLPGLLLSLWLGAVGGLTLAAARKVTVGGQGPKKSGFPLGASLLFPLLPLPCLRAKRRVSSFSRNCHG